MMGYPMAGPMGVPPQIPGAWVMPSMMPGYDIPFPVSNPTAVPVPEESAVPDSVKMLSEHILSLTEQVKILQDKVSSTNVRSDPGRSIYSGATSAVSGSTSNDDLGSSDASEDGFTNETNEVVDNQLA